MLPLFVLLAWAIAELYVIVQVAHLLGVLDTFLLLLASWPLGTWAIRSQGAAAWARLATAIAEGRPPVRRSCTSAPPPARRLRVRPERSPATARHRPGRCRRPAWS